MAGPAPAREGRHDHGTDRDADLHGHDASLLDTWPGKQSAVPATASAASADGSHSRADDLHHMRRAIGTLQGGSTLPDTAQAHFGRLLEADLSGVRIHAGGAASSAATDLGARAFTHGSHIAFAPGAYDPSSATDNHVLAHELVHVVQNQRAGGEAMQLAARMDVGPSGSAVEMEAESGASALTSGKSFSVSARSNLPGISLFGGNEPLPTQTKGAGKPAATTGAPPPVATATPTTKAKPPPQQGANGAATQPNAAATQPNGAATQPNGAATQPTNANGAGGTGGTSAPGGTSSAAPANTGAPSTTSGAPDTTPLPKTQPKPAAGEAKIDARVAEILEQRKDPTTAAQYATTMGAVDSLRLQALQYGFTKSTLGNTLKQMVWPSDAVGDHVGQIYKLNAYRGVDGAGTLDTVLGGIQKGIETFRGIMHLVGDVAAAISGIAGTVAIASAVVAGIAAISIIGNAGVSEVAAGIAAIADQISVATAAIKIACDVIDVFCGIIQMALLVWRAHNAKGDPALRAKFAQLMHKEASDFAGNVVGIGIQVGALAITAGTGASAGKGFAKFTAKDFWKEFQNLWRPSKIYEASLETLEQSSGLLKKGMADIPNGRGILKAGRLKFSAFGNDEKLAALSVVKRTGRGRTIVGANGKPVRKMIDFELDRAGRNTVLTVINTTKLAKFAVVDSTAQIAAAGGAQMTVDMKAPAASGTAPAGGKVEAPQMGKVGGSLSTVQMWPSQIEKFKTTKGLLPAVKERMEEQYNNAKDQAGPTLGALFETKLKAAVDKRNAAKEQAAAVKGDADESKKNKDEGAANAANSANKKTVVDTKANEAKDKGASTMAKSDSLKSPPPKDGVGSWIYNHSIGYLTQLIGWIQNGIKNNVGKMLFHFAGYSAQELDFAGIENDMRTKGQQDQKASGDAASTSTAVDPVQAAVVEMQKDKTSSEQQAIQGMADSKNFIEALEEADKSLDEAIESGNAYMATAGEVLTRQLDTETQQKPIDDGYLQPLLSYADAIATSVETEDESANMQAQANASLAKMQAAVPGLDIAAGQAAIAKDAAAYASGHAAIVAKTQAAVSSAKGVLAAFKGTNDYAGVNANSLQLDHLADESIEAMDKLGAAMCDSLNAMLQQYVDAIKAAEQDPAPANGTDAQQGNPAPANGTNAPPPDPNAANNSTNAPPAN